MTSHAIFKCITAANGGVPVGPPILPKAVSVLTTLPTPTASSTSERNIDAFSTKQIQEKRINICEQGAPDGRFCGFALKFAYNRETGNCEQFWFPGCRTENTNENLFDSLAQCHQATSHCASVGTQLRILFLEEGICGQVTRR